MIHAGGNAFEVRNGSFSFKVKVDERTCSCRMWQLSGLPCVHGTAAILKINKLPEQYVPNWFRKELYYATYHNYLSPVGGIDFWPDQSQYSKVLPPIVKKMPGRPRKKRVRAKGEGGSSTRVSKVGVSMTCQNCFKVGHNKKGCKEPPGVKPVKQKRRCGRPSKEPSSENVDAQTDDVPPPSSVSGQESGEARGQTNDFGGVGSSVSGTGSGGRSVRGSDVPGMERPQQQRAFTRVGGVQFTTRGAPRGSLQKQSANRGFAYWFGEGSGQAGGQQSGQGSGQTGEESGQAGGQESGQAGGHKAGQAGGHESGLGSEAIPTQSSQATKPRVARQQRPFVRPAQRLPSQRILQRKLTKKIHGEGSSQEQAMELD